MTTSACGRRAGEGSGQRPARRGDPRRLTVSSGHDPQAFSSTSMRNSASLRAPRVCGRSFPWRLAKMLRQACGCIAAASRRAPGNRGVAVGRMVGLRAAVGQPAPARRPVAVGGAGRAVTVERDALGIPTIRGRSRAGRRPRHGFSSRAGPLLPDGSRPPPGGRRAGGAGRPAALAVDRRARVHRFRAEARTRRGAAVAEDQARARSLYGRRQCRPAGVGGAPVRVHAPAAESAPWRRRGHLLVVLSMFVTLQDEDGEYESTLATMQRGAAAGDVRPAGASAAPNGTRRWWACRSRRRRCPEPEVYNLRRERNRQARDRAPRADRRSCSATAGCPGTPTQTGVALGSNSWAVAGSLTPDGARAGRQRHAPRDPRAQHLVSRRASSGLTRRAPPSRTLLGGHHAPGRAVARHRQQHPRGLGLHQHLRGLDRPRPAGARSRPTRTATGRRTAGGASCNTTRRSPSPAGTPSA